jgi:CBS domain-containing protein
MTTIAPDITSRLTELSDVAFESFCDDIAGMFGLDIRCERRQAGMERVQALHAHFKKLAAVHLVQGQGALDGQFQLLFDQGGLFILSGVVVMLPQARILEEMKRGAIESTEHLKDPAQEVGNLLVGSWDRVFRAGCEGHQHFQKVGTSIGKPSENPGLMGLSAGGEVLLALYEMTIEPYPSFKCAAVFPEAILAGMTSEGGEPSEPVAEDAPPAPAPEVAKDAAPASVDDISDSTENAAPEPPKDKPQTAPPAQPPVEVSAKPPEPSKTVVAPVVPSPPQPSPPLVPSAPQPSPPAESTVPHDARTEDAAASDILSLFAADSGYLQSGSCRQDSALSDLLHKTAAQIMNKKVVWAGPDSTVQDVMAQMQQHNCGYVLIGANETIEGLVSRSDILGAVSLYLRPMFAKWRRSEDDATLGVKVKWIMSRPVRTVRPDATLTAMIECMRHFGGRCLPVVDERGSVRGIVTVFDILLHILEVDGSFSWQGGAPAAPALMI